MKRLRKDNRGSSLVLVLISMTFMTLLGLTIIAMTITNIRLKAAQKSSQVNFYNTDNVLDTIVAGLQNESSEVSGEAYSDAMAEYSSALSGVGDTLNERYTRSFLAAMIKVLSKDACTLSSDPSVEYFYEDEVLTAYLTAADIGSYVAHTDGRGRLLVDGDTLVLKDVSVIKEEDSYETKINTDIRVDVPAVSTDAHSEYLSYAILADNQIIANAVNATIKGNVYAGTVNRDTTNDTTGILVSGSGSLGSLEISADKIITRGDIKVTNGGALNVRGTEVGAAELWVENLLTGSGTVTNRITIDGECNVADDLEVNGIQDTVKLSGSYYGYNFKEDYSTAGLETEAGYSSAISLNGKDDSLNLENLNNLFLAGRTFISKNVSDVEKVAGISNPDIELGESLAVKSSQLAYFVPGDYIEHLGTYGGALQNGTALPDYGTGADAGKYYFNYGSLGVFSFDYEGYNQYIDVPGFDIMDYVDPAKPVQRYLRHDTSVVDREVVYYYLKFADKEKSSAFYDIFYSDSVQEKVLDSVNQYYVDSNGIMLDNSGETILLNSGNIMYSDSATGALKLKIQNNLGTATNILNTSAKEKARKYVSYQLSLIEDYADGGSTSLWRLANDSAQNYSKSGKKDNTNLFHTLINDTSLLHAYEGAVYGGVAVIADGDYIWDSSKASLLGSNQGLIIATGDVEVRADFEGMILAGGDVKIGSTGITISSNEELLEKMFTEDKGAATPLFFNAFSHYFRRAVDATIGSDADTAPDNVTYDNWTRN